ncbi:MAG: hypothetical protein M3N98_09035 [Actinomycetota bacterium]|nr:hypothetical protein [Actinomycetota bacterium]
MATAPTSAPLATTTTTAPLAGGSAAAIPGTPGMAKTGGPATEATGLALLALGLFLALVRRRAVART